VSRFLFQHTCALESGFRNSGITLGKHGKVILAVRSCVGLEVPLTDDGIMLVSEEVCIMVVSQCCSRT
jgi:tRNA wybutosine-synthesizing protein 3